ncbi:MAG: alanyl-tRNA editing protein [Alphaproteobacteria bacterium]|nr:alanyl-tRNA editing protein [Alphaproteobacteria bacterium]
MADYLFRTDPYAKGCKSTVTHADEQGVRLDRTVFYPLGGGQPGDSGTMKWSGGEARIKESRKFRQPDSPGSEDVLHVLDDNAAAPPPGTEVEVLLDWDRRHKHMRMHTCLHLLSALVPFPVTGGQVGTDKSRLDFDIPGEVADKENLQTRLNKLIAENHPVQERWITDEELAARPELVKTMSVKPPVGAGRVRLLQIGESIDLQPCGGTHVQNTGEIGKVEVVKIESKGKQNRRIVVALAG